jgi:hypothetical protein
VFGLELLISDGFLFDVKLGGCPVLGEPPGPGPSYPFALASPLIDPSLFIDEFFGIGVILPLLGLIPSCSEMYLKLKF